MTKTKEFDKLIERERLAYVKREINPSTANIKAHARAKLNLIRFNQPNESEQEKK